MSDDVTVEMHDGTYTLVCCEYEHAGSTWGIEFYAKDRADADAKAESIRATLRINGMVGAVIPGDHLGRRELIQ